MPHSDSSMTIFIPPQDISRRKGIRLSADKSRYLITVLRAKKGDAIAVIDGRGRAYNARIAEIEKKDVYVDIVREVPADLESPARLVLCQGILKGEKMDLVIQKATELGVKGITPLVTDRCLVRETRKTKRWAKIAEEAAEQCGRALIPEIHEPATLHAWLESRGSSPIRGLVFWEEGGLPLSEAIRKIGSVPADSPFHLLVGPEGGLASEEVERAVAHGFIRATLGKRILRAETAAIVSVALVQFLLGEKED
ncbi:MAG TPA: 16S rRNA (uracil(1498)-N(3))-methyltransferase [Dissulfurispiraceae bacterium]